MNHNLPSDTDLLSKKIGLDNKISQALTSNKKTVKVTVRDKLRLINEQLLRFKNSGISYKIIRRILKEELHLNVSEQTLREHCQQELNFTKRGALVTDDGENYGDSLINKEKIIKVQQKDIALTTPPFCQTNTQENGSDTDTISTQLTEQTTTLIKQIEDY